MVTQNPLSDVESTLVESEINTKYRTDRFTPLWEIKVQHEGLHAYRNIKGATKQEAETKARIQIDAWNARYRRLLERQAAQNERLKKKDWHEKQSDADRRAKEHALALTKDAEAAIAELRELLNSALGRPLVFDWKALHDTSKFQKTEPTVPQPEALPSEPRISDSAFAVILAPVTIKAIDWIIPGSRNKKLAAAKLDESNKRRDSQRRFEQAHATWDKQTREITTRNQNALANHEKAKADFLIEWQSFLEAQKAFNLDIEEFKELYLQRVPEAVTRYCTEVLSRSEYPDSFPRDQAVSFNPDAGIVVVDYELPPQKAISNTRQVKYISNRHKFQEAQISDAEFKRLYDDVVYQICLRTLYELFKLDEINVIKNIVFNGFVQATDKATGADTHPCIMTVQANKAEFLAFNLNQIDLKACFRSLKGISGSKLIDFSPVRPVLTMNREDPRFVGAYDVAESLNDKTNLAAMDWLDFENLIRELFEKEFSKNGGEVKITQASRDGGVDAIAFDPDPIRGGKIVIQAKRYTNTVGVAAVRDLFGTVHNEGATKGILVTTSDYGPDAYEFIKGKPLTLLTGGELLYLLERHGYRAKIDLKEAKRLLGELG
jgi:restriction system protein